MCFNSDLSFRLTKYIYVLMKKSIFFFSPTCNKCNAVFELMQRLQVRDQFVAASVMSENVRRTMPAFVTSVPMIVTIPDGSQMTGSDIEKFLTSAAMQKGRADLPDDLAKNGASTEANPNDPEPLGCGMNGMYSWLDEDKNSSHLQPISEQSDNRTTNISALDRDQELPPEARRQSNPSIGEPMPMLSRNEAGHQKSMKGMESNSLDKLRMQREQDLGAWRHSAGK